MLCSFQMHRGILTLSSLCLRPGLGPNRLLYCTQTGRKLDKNLKEYYRVLKITDAENSDLSEVREAFLKLAKKYHPDGRTETADVEKFNQISEAYRAVRVNLESGGCLEDEEGVTIEQTDWSKFDNEHKAPQHRQYLEFEGIGSGTPFQRQDSYQKYRLQRATNTVSERQIDKLFVDKEATEVVSLDSKKAARKIKTTNFIDRLVDDLIKESMSKGEFENLRNSGKPLPDKAGYSPFLDTSEHNLNQVLVNNGYAPEWIQLEREIKIELRNLGEDLLRARLKLGPEPLNDFNRKKLAQLFDTFTENVRCVNRKIEKRNLLVPLLRLQMMPVRPKWEIEKVLKEYEEKAKTEQECANLKQPSLDKTKEPSTRNVNLISKIGDKLFQRIFFPD